MSLTSPHRSRPPVPFRSTPTKMIVNDADGPVEVAGPASDDAQLLRLAATDRFRNDPVFHARVELVVRCFFATEEVTHDDVGMIGAIAAVALIIGEIDPTGPGSVEPVSLTDADRAHVERTTRRVPTFSEVVPPSGPESPGPKAVGDA